MAVAGMSAGNPDGIGTFPQGGQEEFGAHAAGTGDPDHSDVGRVLGSANTCKVSGSVTAPVTEETDDFRFEISHFILSPLNPALS